MPYPVKVRGHVARFARRLRADVEPHQLGVVVHRRRRDPTMFTAAELGLDPEEEALLRDYRGCCE